MEPSYEGGDFCAGLTVGYEARNVGQEDVYISTGGVFSRNKATGDILIKSAHKFIQSGKLNNEDQESRFIKVFDEILNKQVNNILN